MFSSPLAALLARTRGDDPRATAGPDREARGAAAATVRWADAADIPALESLARLRGAHLPRRPVLVAERDGQLVAALPLGTGSPPLVASTTGTKPVLALLERRAARL